jgi:molybdenum cofactor cytidylyltransferase
VSVAGLLLAAGGGSRFNGPSHKLLALVNGVAIAKSAIDVVSSAGFEEVAVVMGAVDLAEFLSDGVVALHNPNWQSGLASSLQVGISWCKQRGHDAVVVGLGDTPGVPCSAWQAVRDSGAEVAVASFGGALRPPVRLSRSVWGELPSSGDAGARALWHREGAIEVACEGDPFDVDTVEDLARHQGSPLDPSTSGRRE